MFSSDDAIYHFESLDRHFALTFFFSLCKLSNRMAASKQVQQEVLHALRLVQPSGLSAEAATNLALNIPVTPSYAPLATEAHRNQAKQSLIQQATNPQQFSQSFDFLRSKVYVLNRGLK